jgi:hypothetical protein
MAQIPFSYRTILPIWWALTWRWFLAYWAWVGGCSIVLGLLGLLDHALIKVWLFLAGGFFIHFWALCSALKKPYKLFRLKLVSISSVSGNK